MPAGPYGTGTVFKKCDRSNHKPDSSKNCAAGICQPTCDGPESMAAGGHGEDTYSSTFR
jgi:hypothetical protein